VAGLHCHAGGSGVISLTRGIWADTSLPRAPTWHTLSRQYMWRDSVFLSRYKHRCDKKVRSANICLGVLFLK
jgi:hypothetical protein